MQINSVSNGIKFGALSFELQEKMWQAVKRNNPNFPNGNINKSKLYQDYKYILNQTKGDDCLFVEIRDEYDKGRIVEERPYSDNTGKGYTVQRVWNISKAYSKKDPYKEIIKIFAKELKNKDANDGMTGEDVFSVVSNELCK